MQNDSDATSPNDELAWLLEIGARHDERLLNGLLASSGPMPPSVDLMSIASGLVRRRSLPLTFDRKLVSLPPQPPFSRTTSQAVPNPVCLEDERWSLTG